MLHLMHTQTHAYKCFPIFCELTIDEEGINIFLSVFFFKEIYIKTIFLFKEVIWVQAGGAAQNLPLKYELFYDALYIYFCWRLYQLLIILTSR